MQHAEIVAKLLRAAGGVRSNGLLAPEFEAEFRRLGPFLAGRRLRMKAGCPSTKLLVSQLQEFPVAEHDDGPDALEMAIRLAEEMLAGVHDDGLGNRLSVGRD